MKRILLIAPIFAPENKIGAIRTTKLAKYLSRMGHTVSILCAEPRNKYMNDGLLTKDINENSMQITTVFYNKRMIRLYDWLHKSPFFCSGSDGESNILASSSRQHGAWRAVLRNFFISFETLCIDWSFARSAMNILQDSPATYDAVISSFSPFSSHWIAKYVQKRKIASDWIADFRDPPLSVGRHGAFMRLFVLRYIRQVEKRATCVTAVSRGCLSALRLNHPQNGHVIMNGYDKEDLFSVSQKIFIDGMDGCLHFCYCGNTYKDLRDFSPLWRLVAELVEKGTIDRTRILCHYAGTSSADFARQMKLHGLEDRLVDHGFLPREQSLALQQQSDVLLLASWNRKGSTGVVTGKFLEYLMLEKPVLCFVQGDLLNSALYEMIEDAKIGYCYEESRGEEAQRILLDNLLGMYQSAIDGRRIKFEPNTSYIERLSSQNIARMFNSLLEDMPGTKRGVSPSSVCKNMMGGG